MAIAAAQGYVYVADSNDNRISEIDSVTGRVVASIAASGNPQAMAASEDGLRLYVASAGIVDVIDRRMLRLIRSIRVGPQPANLAITPDGRRLFVSLGSGSIEVVDTALFQKIRELEAGSGPHNLQLTPDGTRMIVTSPGRLSFVNVRTEKPEFEIPVRGTPSALAIDFDKNLVIRRLFLQIAGSDGFEIIDYAARKPIGKVSVPAGSGMAIAPDHRTLWIAAQAEAAVTVLSLPDLRRVTSIPVGRGPDSIVFTPDGKRAFVSNAADNSVSSIDAAAYKEIVRIAVGKTPRRMLAE